MKNKFHIFIFKISHKYTDKNLSNGGKDIIDIFIKQLLIYIIEKVALFARHLEKVTIELTMIETILKIKLNDKAEDLIEWGYEHWDYYQNNKNKNKADRAELLIHPSRIKNELKKYTFNGQKIGESAIIFLTAIIEKVVIDILKLAEKKVEKKLRTIEIEQINQALEEYLKIIPVFVIT